MLPLFSIFGLCVASFALMSTLYAFCSFRMNELRLSGEGKLNDAQSELKIKGFHLDRLNVLFDELQAQYKNSTDENLKLKDKIEVCVPYTRYHYILFTKRQ